EVPVQAHAGFVPPAGSSARRFYSGRAAGLGDDVARLSGAARGTAGAEGGAGGAGGRSGRAGPTGGRAPGEGRGRAAGAGGRAAETQADIRALIGWTQSQEELLGKTGVRDMWRVVGQEEEEEDRLRVQRTWLQGKESGRFALVLQFAAPGQAAEMSLILGTVL